MLIPAKMVIKLKLFHSVTTIAAALITVMAFILTTRKSPVEVPLVTNASEQHDVSIPEDVFYIWCGYNRTFEYRHYLSVRSVFLHLNPYRVRLLYEGEPITQNLGYNTWLTELRHEYAFFSIEMLSGIICADKQRHLGEYLSKHGGTYVQEEVIFAGPLSDQWFKSLESAVVLDDKSNDILIQISRRNINLSRDRRSTSSSYNVSLSLKLIRGEKRLEDCKKSTVTVNMILQSSPSIFAYAEDKAMLFKAVVPVVPEHIWELDSEVGRLLRTAAYGKPEIARPVPDFNNLAPNIAHVVWSNKDKMSFAFYLCVLSLLEAAKFDKVFLHGDGPPTGMYWNMIRNHPRLHLVLRTLTTGGTERIYGNVVKVRAHMVDIQRLDIMYRYGGLYVDTDAIFFRPLTRELRAYDAVASPYIFENSFRNFSQIFQNGIMLGKPRAKFWRLYLESMREYYDNEWLWNCCTMMFRIKERHPETLLSEPRLNTICDNFKCHPYWKPHLARGSDGYIARVIKQWRTSTFAIHHTYPDLPEYSSHEALLQNNGRTLFGAVGLHVLEQADKLECFKDLSRCSLNPLRTTSY